MTNNHMLDATVAMVMGTGLGLLLSVGVQKMLNKHYQATCHTRPNHNLIHTQGFLGDQYYCIHNAYITGKS